MLLRFWLVLVCAAAAQGALLRVEVVDRGDVAGGRAFGNSGAYERIVARAYFAVDPKAPANRAIADIDRAPRNEDGLVEFSSDLFVLKPRDPRNGNGTVLFEVSNRGGKGMLGTFNFASASRDPQSAADMGDGYLLEQGYTVAWLGWQFDVPEQANNLRLYAPQASGITGLVRAEVIVDQKTNTHSVADRGHVPYLVNSPGDPALALMVRDRVNGPRRTLPRSSWHIEERSKIVLTGGFEPGRLYDLVYTASDPAIAGLGLAAVRDFIAFLKYGISDETLLSDQRRYIKRAIGWGVSQSGRFLRTFLYYGCNQDEKGRKVFDGVMAHVGGGGRGSFNQRFAQPSRDGHPLLNTLYPTDIFPFTDNEQRDPETGLNDGILSHATPAAMTPKIFYTNSSYEYYGRAASLIHTTLDGKADAALAPATRIYFFAGGQHGPSAFPPRRQGTQQFANPNPYTISLRALLAAMNAWVKDGTEPPPSLYPRIDAKQLVPLAEVHFPKLQGVAFPTRIQTAYRADYGPDFRANGIASIEPPKLGSAFPMLVPQVNEDGNETAGIRSPLVQVPLATYTGWNLRAPEIGAADELFSMQGSWIPFARTRAERTAAGDPRLSIEERYATREEYLQKVGAAARSMADRGLLLDRDVSRELDRAAAMWDYVMNKK